jgi:hypothetical protein
MIIGNFIGKSIRGEYELKTHKQYTVPKKIWLLYFNRVLYEKGMINMQDYCKIKHKISTAAN